MIEILESRIAPAAVFYFTDVDGDHVKVSSSIGTNAQLAAAVVLGNAAQPAIGKPHQLNEIKLDATFAGAAISITATPSGDLGGGISGDGFVNVGLINAPAIDLKSVTIHGDLGQILVGDSDPKHPGLGSLNVQSMGLFGLTTGANAAASRFENGVTSISIAHDVNGVLLRAIASSNSVTTARIGSITVGGNLIGGSAADTGEIAADDGIGSVKILGSVIGGAGMNTGRISTTMTANIGSVFIGGSLIGGPAQASGVIYGTNINSVTVHGSIYGGSATTTGGIDGANLGTIVVGGDLAGSVVNTSVNVDHSGFIRAQSNLKSVTIGGSVESGAQTGAGILTFSGAIQAGQTLQSVKIAGSIRGSAAQPVIISGQGLKAPAVKTQDAAIGAVSIGGDAVFALVEGGYDLNGGAASGDAQIGSVTIGGDMIATSIVAGVKSQTAFFGEVTDTIIDKPSGVASDGIVAKIGSVVVGGQIVGTADTTDMFGIEAQWIGSIKTGGLALPLQKGPGNDSLFLSTTTGRDVHVREFPGT